MARARKRPDERGRHFEETLTALRLLMQTHWRIEELGERLGLTTRTAHRMLERLERAGIPVQMRAEGRYSYRWVERADAEKALGLR